MAERTDAEDLIRFLGELAKLDPMAMGHLLSLRFPCNRALADHGMIQVGASKPGQFNVTVLGILNGYVGACRGEPPEDWGPMTAVFEDDGTLAKVVLTEPHHSQTEEI